MLPLPARIAASPRDLLAAAPTRLGVGFCPDPADPTALDVRACVLLGVPLIQQHKDTQMLLLERPVPSGAHAWDNDHRALDPDDPADNANCGLASLAMMNKFKGGNLSQDRIGYEVFKARMPPGPEQDLNYGDGIGTGSEMTTAYQFALGVTPTPVTPGPSSVDSLWNALDKELMSGRPMLVFDPARAHYLVIVGRKYVGAERVVAVNDPWDDRQYYPSLADVWTWIYYTAGGDFVAKTQEPTIVVDSDGDGIVDFDEIERFHTNPHDPDTDHDGVGDKRDVYASVFDSGYGYALYGTSRDQDNDGAAMELDPDADAGGCQDGEEDANGNGIFEAPRKESWNFLATDDTCSGAWFRPPDIHDALGRMGRAEDLQWAEGTSVTYTALRWKPVPDGHPGATTDATGSTYAFHAAGSTRLYVGECTMYARSWASDAGTLGAAILTWHRARPGWPARAIWPRAPPSNSAGADLAARSMAAARPAIVLGSSSRRVTGASRSRAPRRRPTCSTATYPNWDVTGPSRRE